MINCELTWKKSVRNATKWLYVAIMSKKEKAIFFFVKQKTRRSPVFLTKIAIRDLDVRFNLISILAR